MLLYTILIMIGFVALNNLALTYQEGGKYDKAIKTYETSLDLQRQCDDGNRVEKSTGTFM